MRRKKIQTTAGRIEAQRGAERELCVREIIRCLKRYVAREVYKSLVPRIPAQQAEKPTAVA